MAKVAVIVGGYLGDEGKGKITCHYLEKYNWEHEVLCIRAGGGTNTGATVYRRKGAEDWQKIQVHQLPVGVFLPGGKHGYIGNGVYVNLAILEKELQMMLDVGGEHRCNRMFISKYAHIVTPEHLELDAKKEGKQKMGSTKNGVSVAASFKYQYKGTQFKDLPEVLLDHFKNEYGLEVVDPYEFFTEIVEPNDWNIVVEGTQGIGLDVNHGFQYPYVSAGSFSTYGILDGVGYTLRPDEVVMCTKAWASYFGPVRMGQADFDDGPFRDFAGEYGTTTKRPRNLAWLDTGVLKRAAQHIQPTTLVVNHLDTLGWFSEHGKEWFLRIDGERSMGFSDRAWANEKLTSQGAMFLDALKEAVGVRKVLVGVGPYSSHEHIREY